VAIEYAEPVNAGRLDRSTFRVRDSIYNFRFNPPVNLLVDEFGYGSFLQGGMMLPYHYRLPRGYDPPARRGHPGDGLDAAEVDRTQR
jgi:hypothetical protein